MIIIGNEPTKSGNILTRSRSILPKNESSDAKLRAPFAGESNTLPILVIVNVVPHGITLNVDLAHHVQQCIDE
ncbi:MAG: hypothetical protein MK081_03660 [Flavobacteriales bacterium]|nr:hypothetical protein [Flavobacteriales bacterium]